MNMFVYLSNVDWLFSCLSLIDIHYKLFSKIFDKTVSLKEYAFVFNEDEIKLVLLFRAIYVNYINKLYKVAVHANCKIHCLLVLYPRI